MSLPARGRALLFRDRVKDYHADRQELEHARLGVPQAFFINYGFVTSELQALMHPRSNHRVPELGPVPLLSGGKKKARMLLDFVRERGAVHPRDVDGFFSHGKVTNYW